MGGGGVPIPVPAQGWPGCGGVVPAPVPSGFSGLSAERLKPLTAIVLIEVDSPVTDEVLEKVKALPQVVRAKALQF